MVNSSIFIGILKESPRCPRCPKCPAPCSVLQKWDRWTCRTMKMNREKRRPWGICWNYTIYVYIHTHTQTYIYICMYMYIFLYIYIVFISVSWWTYGYPIHYSYEFSYGQILVTRPGHNVRKAFLHLSIKKWEVIGDNLHYLGIDQACSLHQWNSGGNCGELGVFPNSDQVRRHSYSGWWSHILGWFSITAPPWLSCCLGCIL